MPISQHRNGNLKKELTPTWGMHVRGCNLQSSTRYISGGSFFFQNVGHSVQSNTRRVLTLSCSKLEAEKLGPPPQFHSGEGKKKANQLMNGRRNQPTDFSISPGPRRNKQTAEDSPPLRRQGLRPAATAAAAAAATTNAAPFTPPPAPPGAIRRPILYPPFG